MRLEQTEFRPQQLPHVFINSYLTIYELIINKNIGNRIRSLIEKLIRYALHIRMCRHSIISAFCIIIINNIQ